jgi:hypothetical protein
MESKYRIKVEERKNGVTFYIPQVCIFTKIFGFIPINKWYNILNFNDGVYDVSTIVECAYYQEYEAREWIEKYKISLSNKDSKKITKTKYIDIQ